MRTSHDMRKGMTLIELTISMALFGLVTTMLTISQTQFYNANRFIQGELENEQATSQVLQQMVTEIRSAGPSSLGGYPIESASSTSFIFFSDYNGDGLAERIRYTIGTSTVVRGEVKPAGNPLSYVTSTETTRILVTGVVSSTSKFDYYNASYTGTQSPMASTTDVTQIRIVRITIYADLNPSFAPQPSVLSDTVTIRNLRSN